ncbi:MAG: TetR/AcrR family transcriptional regulator [Luminiphilus sp.]
MKKKKSGRPPARKPGIERYDLVIGAAERLIRDAGSLEALTLKAVSDEARVPRVSLYYFFPSIEALIDALYQRGIEKLVTALSDAPEEDDWQTVMELLMDGTRDFYARNPVEMILSLSPKSLVSVNRANQQIGRDVYDLLVAQTGLAKSRKLARACEVATELADAVYRKSFIEHGKITADYHHHAKTAVIGYLDSVINQLPS